MLSRSKVVQRAKDANIPLRAFNREPATDVVKATTKLVSLGQIAKEAGIIQGGIAELLETTRNMTAMVTAN